MEQLTRNASVTTRLMENKSLIELGKILAYGSVFPVIYLLGKFFTQF